MNKRNLIKLALLPLLAIVFTFGLSYVGTDRDNPSQVVVDVSGFNKAYADSDGWEGVRSFATLVRAASRTFNALYSTIQGWGLFNFHVTFDGPIAGTDFYVYVSINGTEKSVAGTVDTGAVTYTNGIQIKHGGSSGDVVFQFYFDDPSDSSGGDGCLLIVKPYYFEAIPGTVFSSTGTFEARVKKPSTDKIMYISFNGNPWKDETPTYAQSGRVKLVDDGSNYNITGLIYVHVDGSSSLHSVCPVTTPATGSAFYTLAYIADNDSPYYSTALWGWNNTDKSSQLCSVDNQYNYGHFNATTGFVCDGSPDTDCPDGSPYPLNIAV